jgi:hypothetical protein
MIIFYINNKESKNYFSQSELFETLSKTKVIDISEHNQVYTYKTGAVYSGSWLGGFRHGRGLMKWEDGTFYNGEWNLGYAEGKGMLMFGNGDYKKGTFMYNKLYGYGEYYHAKLNYAFKGLWEGDLQNGKGMLLIKE